MKGSWRTETGRLEFRWSDPIEPALCSPPRIDEAPPAIDRSAVSSLPDFAAHSPLGSGEWFSPWNTRWSVPDR
jgi:hypothetical protein